MMKKIYFLLIFALTVSVSFAQTKNSRLTSLKLNHPAPNAISKNDLNLQTANTQVKATECDAKVTVSSFNSIRDAVQARLRASQAAPSVQYVRPDGSLLRGFTRNYIASTVYLRLYAPAEKTLDFVPYSDTPSATFSWTIGSLSLADETDSSGVLNWYNGILPAGYIYNMPQVIATNSGDSSTYTLGQGVTYQYMYAGYVNRDTITKDGTNLGTTEEYPPLTLANLQANKRVQH